MQSMFNEWVFKHAEYKRARTLLVDRIDHVSAGGRAFVYTLLGQSSSGKSELVKDVIAKYDGHTNSDQHRLVLSVSVPVDAPDIYGVHSAVMQRMIGPLLMDRRTSGTRSRGALVRGGAGVLIIDELNHLIEKHTTRTAQTKGNRSFADWVKELVDDNISVVLVGLPHVQRVLDDNEQLAERALRPVRMLPYKWIDPDQRAHYCEMVTAFVGRFREQGWPIEIDADETVRASYLCTGGLVGRLARLMFHAEELGTAKRGLTMDLLARAFDLKFEPEWGNPFRMHDWPDALLMKAYSDTIKKGEAPTYQEGRSRNRRSQA